MTIRVTELAPGGRAEVLGLMREVYGEALSEEEFDWYFGRAPVREPVLNVAEDDGRVGGFAAMMPARALVDGLETRVAFAVHAATHPASRGKGIFSRLELANEQQAANGGAEIALGFTNRLAGPILVGSLGWRDLYRMRIWARPSAPLRAARARGGTIERFTQAQERAWRAVAAAWGSCLVRDAAYLTWRYTEAPRDYRAVASENGYAVVGRTVRRGIPLAVVCDLVGPAGELRGLIRSCLRRAPGGTAAAIAVPAPGQREAYLSLGFLPTPQTIRVIGKPLLAGAPLPTRWHFSLGDTDFL